MYIPYCKTSEKTLRRSRNKKRWPKYPMWTLSKSSDYRTSSSIIAEVIKLVLDAISGWTFTYR
jgi:hypothetical protein